MICIMIRSNKRGASAAYTPDMVATQATTDFGLALFEQLKNSNDGENIFFSPFSISNALAIAAEGAREQTALEMGNVLSLPVEEKVPDDSYRPWKLEKFHVGIGQLNERFNREEKPYTLHIANAVWGEQSYPFSNEYLDVLEYAYGEGLFQTANFRHHPEKERLRINTWVEEATGSNIKDLIAKELIDKSTEMVLVNAIYFKANWLNQFDKSQTEEGDFFLDDNECIKVKLMNAKSMTGIKYGAFNGDGSFFKTPEMINLFDESDSAHYPSVGGFSIIELPYKGNELSMVVFLPKDKSSRLEHLLNHERLYSWIKNMEERKVDITLPKFKVEAEYVLNNDLKEMGMEKAFSSANFDGMVEGSGSAGLHISSVVHKAFIEVDEEGSEAAAATALIMAKSAVQPFVPVFRADKPFIYLIRDTQSGTILFLGRMTNPSY
eukprot:CAMPEP_0185726496 /NCGR_PEP_ID=MMETSP1171-20130828/2464_1 /TAXON_ID=374046 /ORGANISM="Helicotheca tamensis, Strain CCMP826" /LENGTH=435 /DNA_ID=CAMNT_0028394865 /DNA_START=149 /DNA_END=1456 /DNA_ORIENTATION=-